MMCTMRLISLKRFALRSKVTSTYLWSFLTIAKASRVGVNSMNRSVGIVIEGLDVADAAIIILELTLNEKIGLIGGRQIQVIVDSKELKAHGPVLSGRKINQR